MGSTPMGGSYAPIRTAQFNFTHQDHPVCHILPGSSGRGASSGSRHGVRDRVVAFELAARKLEPVITLRCGATLQSPRHYEPCASSRLGAASPDATDQRFNTATSWYQDSDAAGSPRRLVHYSGTAGGGPGAGPGSAVPRFG
jgi:hypothetical protein